MVIGKRTEVFRGTFSSWGGVGSGEGNTWKDPQDPSIHGREFHEGDAGFSRIIKKIKTRNK